MTITRQRSLRQVTDRAIGALRLFCRDTENGTISAASFAMPSFWTCAQTRPQAETLAIRNLRRQGFVCFYPFFLLRNKYRHYSVKPAFPGYVFIELEDGSHWTPINGTTGVRQLLTAPTKGEEYLQPCRVPFVGELRRLRIHNDGTDNDLIPVGTMVRITKGPLTEHVALVTLSAVDRVRLLVNLFSRQVSVDIEAIAVETLSGPVDGLA